MKMYHPSGCHEWGSWLWRPKLFLYQAVNIFISAVNDFKWGSMGIDSLLETTSVLASFLSLGWYQFIYDECFILNSPVGQVCQEALVDLVLLQNVGHNIHHWALPFLPSPLSLHALPSVHSVRKRSTSWRKFFLQFIQHTNETDGPVQWEDSLPWMHKCRN